MNNEFLPNWTITPIILWACGLVVVCWTARPAMSQEPAGKQNQHSLTVLDDHSVVVRENGTQITRFEPKFVIFFTKSNPKLALRPMGGAKYNVVSWYTGKKGPASVKAPTDSPFSVGDGFDPAILKGDHQGRTTDVFAAAPRTMVQAVSSQRTDRSVDWRFDDDARFELKASVTLADNADDPTLTYSFKAKQPGYFSIAYVGAPAISQTDVQSLWQPLMWNAKRFPKHSYVTLAFRCPLPGAFVFDGKRTTSVVADPQHIPFQPLPVMNNSQFGVALRDPAGQARPMILAPVLGGSGSMMKAGQTFTFRAHLVSHSGDVDDALEHVARTIYQFEDHRRNTNYSLNDTLENMIDYGMSKYSRFNEDLRGASYATDVPGAVKNVSALHPLSAAIVTDNPAIYKYRARPMIEYVLSREKFLFVTDPSIVGQHPGWKMHGPCAPVTELAALHVMTAGRNPHLLALAKQMLGQDRVLNLTKPEPGTTWQNLLAVYRATGDREYLERSKTMADQYIREHVDQLPQQLSDGFFWTGFVPDFQSLYQLYETTGEQRYLDAAQRSARAFAQFVWVCPVIPDQDVTVNENGKAPHYYYLRGKGHPVMTAAKETVPAWRLSEIGLTCESSGTSQGHRAVLLANHAPWLLRIAQDTSDQFLHDVARSAIVGRYANFPGYHINTGRTTIYEKPDYPLREHKALSYNSFHYNHVWPHIALLIDYLVSDVVVRSDGKIDFASEYAEGYAYLRNKVYGSRPGKFYDYNDARLWMPKGLLTIDNPQINYIAARGEGRLYLALSNQDDKPATATIRINNKLVRWQAGTPTVIAWRNGEADDDVSMNNGTLQVTVPAGGLLALAIDSVLIRPRIDLIPRSLDNSSAKQTADLDVGDGARAMLLSLDDDHASAYIYLRDTFKTASKARLRYKLDGKPGEMVDDAYPFEFTIPMPAAVDQITFTLEVTTPDGKVFESPEGELAR